MKARVKATGEIVELSNCSTIVDTKQRLFTVSELEDISDETDKVLLDELDEVYWANMKHQYAGMAMQGMIKTYEQMMRADIECKMDCCERVDAEVANEVLRSHAEACAEFCAEFATALVEKLKESKV